MQFVAVQCLTGEEPIVKYRILEKNNPMIADVFTAPKSITSKFSAAGEDIKFEYSYPGYVFVGFEEWQNEIYHAVKVEGVIRPLVHYKDSYVSGIMDEDELLVIEPELITEIEASKREEHAHILAKTIEKAKEFVRNRKKWISLPGKLFTDANAPLDTWEKIWNFLDAFIPERRRQYG